MADQNPSTSPEALVLVIVAHAVPCVLYIGSIDGESHDPVHDQIKDIGDVRCLEDVFDDLVPDGLWVITLTIVDDGPPDISGAGFASLKIVERRCPTADEWRKYADDEHIWGIPVPEDF